MTRIVLTKQAAARRLIVAGIRMVARSDDPLAIHVVASSALNMLRELVEQRGPGYAAQSIQEALYQAGLARVEGRQTGWPWEEALDHAVQQVAAGISGGTVRSASDISILMPPGTERSLLDGVLRPFNYLKHAQRDALATMDEAAVKPVDALIHSIHAYSILFPGEQLPEEVLVFLVSHGVFDG